METNFKVLWSICHAGPPDFEQAKELIDLAVGMEVDGIELALGIEDCVTYRDFGGLGDPEAAEEALERRRAVGEIAAYAKERGLSVGMWLHEVSGPPNLLDALPGLRAEDGFLDLESQQLGELIEATVAEFCEAVPELDEIVLTLTETQVCVLGRPFSTLPLPERALAVIGPVIEAARYYGKGVVVRPFSPLASECQAVLDALEKVNYENLAVMEKTEPHDWHPFLPGNPWLRKVKEYELRAEADACGEYYGLTHFPACYPQHLVERLAYAADRGATAFVLRADRKGRSVARTLNEFNLIAATAWLKDSEVDVERLWPLWAKERLGASPEGLPELLAQTFEVVKRALYIDGQPMSHIQCPRFDNAKHIQLFSLFEPGENLRHLRDNWGVLSDRAPLSHADILREKKEAVSMATALAGWFKELAPEMPPESRQSVADGLRRLELASRASLALCRMVSAHLAETWGLPDRPAGDFEAEAAVCKMLAGDIESGEGADFFGGLPARLREFAERLAAERALEAPRRQELDADETLADYLLCGFASEGHKLCKRLHTGSARADEAARHRATGAGDLEGFSYELKAPAGEGFALEVDMEGGPRPAEGVLWLGPDRIALRCDAPEGEVQTQEHATAPGALESPTRVEIWSTGAEPLRVREIRVRRLASGNAGH